jgi:hypothetical protein
MAVYFPREQKPLAEIEAKFVADFRGVAKNKAKGMAFVTNQELRESERRDLKKAVDGEVEIFHLERVVALLDRPDMAQVREQFLAIEALRAPPLAPQAKLEELDRASLGRCIKRWQAAGLAREESIRLAKDRNVGRIEPALLPTKEMPVVVWTAAMGSGKSIAAERFHQDSIATALAEDEAPVPVYLEASLVLPDLEEAGRSRSAEVGDPRTRGAMIIIDGVDELGYDGAAVLLGQARVLTEAWPNTRVLLVSRPMRSLGKVEEHRELPLLSEEQVHEVVELAAGRQVRHAELSILPKAVSELMTRPLFALLAGAWMRENDGVPRASIDLFAELGRHASETVKIDQAQLRALAVLAVRRDLGEVAQAEIASSEEIDRLRSSGIVDQRGAGLVFTLPALAQWFASQAIAAGEVSIAELMEAPEDLELWRYPLALCLVLSSSQFSSELLREIFAGEPGFGFRVLDEVSSKAILGGATPPPWRQGGEQVREALQTQVDALGPAGKLVAATDEVGKLRPLGVATNRHHLSIVSYVGEEPRPDVFQMPADYHPWTTRSFDWGEYRSAGCGPGSAWAWEWARQGISHNLERLVKERGFPIPPEGPLAEEAIWPAANALLESRPFVTESLSLADLLAAAEEMLPEDPDVRVSFSKGLGEPTYELDPLLAYLRRRHEAGEKVLPSPLPSPDQLKVGGGWIGDFFSEDRLLEIADVLYRKAIVAYTQLVERWLAPLAPRLEHRVLLPIRVVGLLNSGKSAPRDDAFLGIPRMSGYLEALPEGAESEVQIELSTARFDYSRVTEVWREQQDARPQAARWLSGTAGGMSFEVGRKNPIADVVYQWLAHDLQRLGLVGPLAGHSHDRTRTVWEREG